MQQTGDDGSSINSSLAAACTSNQYSCSNRVATLQQKYYGLLTSCNGDCAAASIYSAVYQRLTSIRSACDQLSAQGDALSRQGLQAGSSAYASYCGTMAQASPQSAGDPSSPAASGSSSGPSSVNCQANPTASGCGGQAAAAAAAALPGAARGAGGFVAASGKANKFNLGDNADQVGGTGFQPQASTPGQPPTVTPVPGGGGGFGGGGGGGSANSGGGASGGRASPGSPGYSTDIDRGLRSGGGYSAGAGGMNADSSGAGGGREPASAGDPFMGMDLKQFLPGGKRDPTRRLAGSVVRSQINLKEEDIWTRISNKYIEKCKLGELWRCE